MSDVSEKSEEFRNLGEMTRALDVLLRRACERDQSVREAIAAASAWLGDIARTSLAQAPSEGQPMAIADAPSRASAPAAELASPTIAPKEPPPQEMLPLRLGGQVVQVSAAVHDSGDAQRARASAQPPPPQPAAFAAQPVSEPLPDLSLVARRCRLKGEGCRWAIRRRRLVADGAEFRTEIRPHDHTFRERCEPLDNCILWMLSSHRTLPDDGALERIAACYENLAQASDLARAVHESFAESAGEDDDLEASYHLLAEAQSALRKSLIDIDDDQTDTDQFDAFKWLKIRTSEDRVYVSRHMRLNDPADPAAAPDLAERIQAISERREDQRRSQKRRSSLLNKARYHARRIADAPDSPDARADWATLLACVDELVSASILRPSNVELRDILLPVSEAMPDDLDVPASAELVLREIDRYLATREQAEPDSVPAPSPVTQRAIELLRGRVVVLFGGEYRPQRKSAIERDLQLKELRWVALRDHESLDNLEPEIARSDVDLVLLLKRWCSHMHEDVRALCDRHAKAYVRIPAGYHPNQIAHQFLEQASEKLVRSA